MQVESSRTGLDELGLLLLAQKGADAEVGCCLRLGVGLDDGEVHGVVRIVLRIHIINIRSDQESRSQSS